MGLHGVPELVDALDGRVAGGVESDGVVGASDVVVNGGGDAHHTEAHAVLGGLAGDGQGPPEGAVAADGHNAVQTQQAAGGQGLGPARFFHEFQAPGGVEHGAAFVDDVADAGGGQGHKVAGDQAVPAPADADAADAPGDGGPDHRPHRRVHARRVAAAGEDADSLYLFLHNKTLLTNFTGRARFAPGRRSAVERAGRQPIFSCIP